jgi:hypothetical protein
MSADPSRPLCLHCHARPSNRPRGLCWRCYYTPGVAGQYPARKYGGGRRPTGRRTAGPRSGKYLLPPAPAKEAP